MATYATTAHKAAHTACATESSHRVGSREAAIVPTAAAAQPKATCRAKGALARRAARLTSRIQSRSINEPPRANIDPLPTHPATPGLTALEILKRELASHRSNRVCADLRESSGAVAAELPESLRLQVRALRATSAPPVAGGAAGSRNWSPVSANTRQHRMASPARHTARAQCGQGRLGLGQGMASHCFPRPLMIIGPK